MLSETGPEPVYRVVVNDEEQYSIWPFDGELPAGWVDVGRSGDKAECLAFIDEVWIDMPRSASAGSWTNSRPALDPTAPPRPSTTVEDRPQPAP
ncbi:MbtH family protein [Streptomyces demainii]|uniref:Uncharacterized protein YbdZ (MbtH family) n=1 Tax=Streptomyces demainii TaxID=588122 RepID=A0ABT9KXU4_9ACTN|nr:uncharacterized protein YbdZ (MbtH family) [Streptomyces demainii]